MPRLFSAAVAIAFSVPALNQFGLAAQELKPPADLPAASLDGAFWLVQEAVEKDNIPGAIALVAQHGKIIREEAFGLSDVEHTTPMTPRTLCWIASITKPVTVAAAMKLVESGQLGLDDPVEKFLPEFREQKDREGRHPIIN